MKNTQYNSCIQHIQKSMSQFLWECLALSLIFIQTTNQTARAKANLIASSGKEKVQLVELYTSESCSSCPPADAWMATLKDRPDLWKKFVPIAFHVDYWNYLGWKDDYSSDLMTGRQVSLSKLWKEPAVYTPSFIVDGHEWKNWRSEKDHFPSSENQKIELSLLKDNSHKDANDEETFLVKASGLDPNKKYIVRLAKLGMGLSTDVKGGENSGRLLTHNFIILAWNDSSKISGKNNEATISLKSKKTKKPSRFAIAAWIEEFGNPTPLQSVGAYL